LGNYEVVLAVDCDDVCTCLQYKIYRSDVLVVMTAAALSLLP
jgi:hypothetical protein